ncbi:MAG: hypothetical protein HF978_06600 [Desulfobacteraceae bacterium]|nr:hypothetical protein [Desulfobacteraceae bacterium]MBC2755201.1 hypothetical protein [Desulfobacteraceae bacterium]
MKRKKSRRKYLGKLAVKDPSKFNFEWAKRLDSWSLEAVKYAGLINSNGIPVSSVFDLVDRALDELKACGEEAVLLEGDKTRETMMDSCCRAVAKVIDHRIYRPINAQSNYQLMTQGTHKPAR